MSDTNPPDRVDLVTDWNASSDPSSPYSEKVQELHRLFDTARVNGLWNYLYIYINELNELSYIALPNQWNPTDLENHLNLLKQDQFSQVIVAMDLRKSFDSQIRSGNFNPEQFVSWESLRYHPLDCINSKALPAPQQPAGYLKHPEPSPLYRKIESIFSSNQEQGHKTLFVFIDAWAELSFIPVSPDKNDWVEHDRIAKLRGGGYAIMAFDLRRPFSEKFPAHRYGQFNEGQREGLNYFSNKPLINIPDRNGVTIPAEEERVAAHKLLYGPQLYLACTHKAPDSLPPKKYIDFRPRDHLRLAK